MVLRQIREERRVVLDPMHAELLERVGGNLHDDDIDPGVRHLSEKTEKIDGFRRGAVRRETLVPDHVADRADDADFFSCLLGDGFHHIRRGGLAVRAGHPDHAHLALRITVEGGRHLRHGFTGVPDNNLRNVKRKLPFRQKRRSACLHGFFRKLMPVKKKTDDTAEHAPGFDFAGVVFDRYDIRVFSGIAETCCHSEFR